MLTVNEIRTAQRWARRRLFPLGLTVVAPATIALLILSACGDDKPAADASATATLAGTSWTLAGVTAAGKTVAAVADATLAFDAAGTKLTGSTGCNQYSGTYVQTGTDVKITLGPTTLAACGDPAKTVQEAAILAGLPNVASFALGTQLVLKDSSGSTLFTYDKGKTSLEGTSWKATGINNGKGAVESTTLTETVTADFGTGGALSGNSGCNTYNATYTLSGTNGIAITGVAGTRKACADDAMAVEGQYLAALDKVTTYTISGSTLTLQDSGGSTLVTYTLAT